MDVMNENEQMFVNKASGIIHDSRLGITMAEEERNAVFILANEAIRFGDYERAEKILKNELYEVEFKDYQRSFRTYKELEKLILTVPLAVRERVMRSLSNYLEGILEKKEALNNFDQRISPMILEIRKRAEGEIR